jgi:hypothetical protein
VKEGEDEVVIQDANHGAPSLANEFSHAVTETHGQSATRPRSQLPLSCGVCALHGGCMPWLDCDAEGGEQSESVVRTASSL